MLEIAKPKFLLRINKVERGIYTFYYLNDAKKDFSGKTIKGKLLCKFKKGTEIFDGDVIEINKAYLDWYKKGYEYKTIIFITDFNVIKEQKKEEAIIEYKEEVVDDFEFEEIEDFDF